MKRLLWILPLCLMLSACGAHTTEPEQLYLVSAIGFDRMDAGIRVVAEVPLTRENEADKMEVCVFAGEGATIPNALQQMKRGLGKELFFGHCALAVLGDGVEEDWLNSVLDFLNAEDVPLSVTVISAPDAQKLLARGSVAASAAGYEIPDILRLQIRESGLSLQCRLYEIETRKTDFVLPRFEANGVENAAANRFCGTRNYRNGMAVTE